MLASVQRLLLAASNGSSISSSNLAATKQLLQRCWFGSTTAAMQQPALNVEALTQEQQQHLKALQYLVARPLESARNAAVLTALTASYRDLYVIMDQLHKRDILGIPRPLVDEPPAPSSSSSSSSSEAKQWPGVGSSEQQGHQQQEQQKQQQPVINRTQMFYPVRDFTQLPDEPPPVGGWLRNHLSDRYMTRITAFAQLLPNHLEVSYQTGAQIFLWPPMEAYYPGFMDFDNMLRYLKPGLKMRRNTRSIQAKRSRCKLGFKRNKPYHKQRVV